MNWKNLIVIGLIVVVAGGVAIGWSRFSGSSTSAPVTSSGGGGTADSGALLSTLGTLQGLKFDTSFFEDRLYKSLQDFTPDITVPKTQGLSNPFVAPEAGQ